MRFILLKLIRGYQLFVSPVLGSSCRFAPSCSHYTYQAITEYGAIKGGYLGMRRVCRCHPWGGSGYDPVPPSLKKNK